MEVMEIFTKGPAAYSQPQKKQSILPKIDSKPQYNVQDSPSKTEKTYDAGSLDSP